MPKKSKPRKTPRAGYDHFLRSGAGPHKDRKKEASRTACRRSKKAKEKHDGED